MSTLLESILRVAILNTSQAGTADDDTAYVFRDQFAGSVDPLASGSGRTVTGTRWKLVDGWLRGGTQVSSVAWGNSEVVYAGIDRADGRTLAITAALVDRNADIAFGWGASAAFTDPRAQGFGFLNDDGSLAVITPGGKVTIDSSAFSVRPMEYTLYCVLGTQGCAILLSTFAPASGDGITYPMGIAQSPELTVLWVDLTNTTTPLYPYISALDDIDEYMLGHAVDVVAVVDMPDWAEDGITTFIDRFTRANSTTTMGNGWTAAGTVSPVWGINNNQAYCVSGAGFLYALQANVLPSGDGKILCTIVAPTTVTDTFGVLVRMQNASNFIRVTNDGGASIKIQSFIGGAFDATIAAVAYTWVAGQSYALVIEFIGNRYRVYINGVVVLNWSTDSNNRLLTATGAGLYAPNAPAGLRFDNFAGVPHTVTIPAAYQSILPQPHVFTVGSVITSDTFTDTNGTSLDAHTPDAGGAWTLRGDASTDFTIQSNAVVASGDTGEPLYVTQNLGVHDYQVTTPIRYGNYDPETDQSRAGFVVRYTDASHHVFSRTIYESEQADHPEIEIVIVDDGAGGVEHKVQFTAGAFAPNTTYEITTQVCGNVLHILKDGKAVESFILPPSLRTGQHAGLYEELDASNVPISYESWVTEVIS